MPWPMMHFAIAIELFHNNPSPSFLLGSIAPDAVLVHKDHREMKRRSHLGTSDRPPGVQDLLSFYKSHATVDVEEEFRLYVLGYMSHIYADMRWDEWRRELISNMPDSAQPSRELLWREEHQLDINLYRTSVWTDNVKRDVNASLMYELADLYQIQDLDQWRGQIFAFLDNHDHEPRVELRLLTEKFAGDFIRQVSAELHDLIEELERRSL